MEYLILFPERKQNECASYFGVTPTWLSQIIHSDAFQARLRDRQDEKFTSLTLTLREKMEGVGHQAVEALADALEAADPDDPEDRKFIGSATDKVLGRLGYGTSRAVPAAPGTTNVQQNFYAVTKEDLASARALMAGQQRALPHDQPALIGKEVSPSEEYTLGEIVNNGAQLCVEPEVEGGESPRDAIREESA